MTNIQRYTAWLEAQYALGRHEAALGHTLTDAERRSFIQAYMTEYANPDSGKIGS
jgi:hypothetical protein